MVKSIELKVVLTKTNCGAFWHAQCVDYDIGSQGPSREDALDRLAEVLVREVSESLDNTGAPFGDVPVPPQSIVDQWTELGGMTMRIEGDNSDAPGHDSLAQFASIGGYDLSNVALEAKCA